MFNFPTAGLGNHFRNAFKEQPMQQQQFSMPQASPGLGFFGDFYKQNQTTNQPQQPNSFQGYLPNQLNPLPMPKPIQPFNKEPGQYGMTNESQSQQLFAGSRGGGTEGFNYLHRLGVQPSFGLMSQTMGAPQTYNPFNSGLSQQR